MASPVFLARGTWRRQAMETQAALRVVIALYDEAALAIPDPQASAEAAYKRRPFGEVALEPAPDLAVQPHLAALDRDGDVVGVDIGRVDAGLPLEFVPHHLPDDVVLHDLAGLGRSRSGRGLLNARLLS